MARREVLTTVKGGIDRLRTKGAALKDVLFDLVNGYVTSARTVKIRPGTFLTETLPTGTIGLVAFEGDLHIFSHNVVSSIPSGYVLDVLKSPDGDLAITKIHFAEPFLGALYIAAEFSNGNIYHFWVRSATIWQADTEYNLGALVSPAVTDGFAYEATRLGNPYPSWTPNAPRAVDDIIEPTVYNGYYFKVISVVGDEPRSGDIEPIWPTNAGETVLEDTDGTLTPPDATPPTPVIPVLPDDDRYTTGGRTAWK
jgi:hypothetical protein